MIEKLVSIITPSFNAADFIKETIESVQNQNYTNWELLIIDDCSTDDTINIIEHFATNDNRIKLYKLKKNSGTAKARNVGIEAASGKYIAFLDADDIWFNDFIETSVQTINKTGIPFVFSSIKRCDENKNFIYSDFIVPAKVTYHDTLKTNSIVCSTAFLDIETLGKKYMPNIRKRQDMGLWLQYLKEIPFAYGITTPKAIYRIRQNSLSRDKKKLLKYQWQFYRQIAHLDVFKSTYYMIIWAFQGYLKYRK
jgi:teichuronic acid biosynthesis glycosyltransferase TuaG